MNWLLSALLCILVVELVRLLPLAEIMSAILETVGRSIRLVGAPRISDHWKEKAMGAYARATFVDTGRLGLALALVVGVAIACVVGLDRVSPGFQDFMLGWVGIGWTLLFATGWYMVQKRLRQGAGKPGQADGAYSAGDRLLHRMALDSRAIADLSFNLDQKLVGKQRGTPAGRHIFVAGLARSGTTILMRRFYASGAFRSLTYRDMPFVLAPNLWRRISGVSRKEGQLAERAHGDRIAVDFDSPESLDEAFWRVFDGPAYIRSTHLVPHAADDALLQRYRDYVHAVLQASARPMTRYLCKNNNNMLRLPALRTCFPEALLLVPFREPLDHAGSLLRMHRTFLAQQSDDPFVTSYMGWLGHHEFGGDHRPFRFRADADTGGNPGTLDYWLDRWIEAYRHVDATLPEGALLVCYEDLCDNHEVWNHLAEIAGVAAEDSSYVPFTRGTGRAADAPCDPARLAAARALYARLQVRADREAMMA